MLEPQETILIADRYRFQRLLRRGGMSQVYLAYDMHTQRDVAIKLVSSDDPDCIARLKREVRTLSKLTHDHMLPTLDHGKHYEWHYLVMPYMKNGTLRERLAKGPLTLQEAGNVLTQIAGALQFAHDHRILHRDIKPSNILLDSENGQHVYLADFGLAKAIGEGSDITQTGCLIGTAEYMAPELVDRPESPSSDIYALGIVLYQMLTGQVPFKGSTPLSVYWKHIQEQPVPPSYLNPAIPLPVEQVIMRALAKDPAQRFQSARDMALSYTHALQASVGINKTVPGPGPVLVTLKKVNSVTLPLSIQQTGTWWQNFHRKSQTGIVAYIAVLFLLVAPLSLGFLLSRDGTGAPQVLSASAQFGAKLVQTQTAPTHHTSPTTQSTPSNLNTQQPGSLPSYHKHKHRHEHEHEHDGEVSGSDEAPTP